jgi:adenylate cyclase
LRKILLLCFLAFITRTAFAQKEWDKKIDSLRQLSWKAGTDSFKVNILNKLIIEMLAISEYDSAMLYANRSMEIAKSINYTSGLAVVHFNIGNIYDSKENEGEAVKYYLMALKIFESINDRNGVAKCYNNIGSILRVQRNYREALKFYMNAVDTYKFTANQSGLAKVYGNLGTLYCDMNEFSRALDYLQRSLSIQEKLQDTRSIPIVLNNIANVYTEQKNYQQALNTYLKTLPYFEKNGNKRGTATAFYNIGNVYMELKDFIAAKKWFKRSLELSHKISLIEVLDAGYENLAFIDSTEGDFKSAYDNFSRHILFRDSMHNQKTTERLVEEQMQFVFDKKTIADSLKVVEDQKIAGLKLQRQRAYTFSGVAVALLLAAFAINIFKSHKKLRREKQKSDDLLLNILPSEIANEIKIFGKAKAKAHENVTVLFTDFIDFTKISEKLSAEEIVSEIDRCFQVFDSIIEKHGLEKIKTIGDGYMAASGLPVADEAHAIKAVSAALEMNRYVRSQARTPSGTQLEMRVGLHSGRVVAGIVGLKKYAYDIWGDTVNTAARMEQFGEPGEINISGATFELVKTSFVGFYRGKVNVKGKGEVDMYVIRDHTSMNNTTTDSAEFHFQA